MLRLSADSIFALHKTNGTGKTNIQKEGVGIHEVKCLASDKTQILELVDTPGHMKPSNLGHMISHGQEAYLVSLKRRRLVKIIVC